ncbi:hypothetical protein SAMN05414139_10010 [Burkholderia sp. D7]|nr:hypothetical protein SAMN05414139_10010 [Burkholderia sp. D7]
MPWTFVEIMETETSGTFPDSNSRVPMIAATFPTSCNLGATLTMLC